MTFDSQAFKLAHCSKTEALEILRGEAQAGRPLSPRAIKVMADLFDPRVDNRGALKRAPNYAFLCKAGFIHAIVNHGLLPLKKGQTWKEILATTTKSRRSDKEQISEQQVERQIYSKNGKAIYQHNYALWAFRVWAYGLATTIKFAPLFPTDIKRSALLELSLFEELSPEQVKAIEQMIF